ncbi:MAG: hypothetical protein Pg6C_05230 [Treponemataceae bacterium]|nr:MAG: hypothetical protein Pg6C_05230 [Treponemataceae bacterium]
MSGIDQAVKDIDYYLNSDSRFPFFLATGCDSYHELKKLIAARVNNNFIRTSDHCLDFDKRPDIDSLFATIENSTQPAAVLGLGEYLALQGKEAAQNYLSDLKGRVLRNSKVIIVLRGITEIVRQICIQDRRIKEKNCAAFAGNEINTITVTIVYTNIELSEHLPILNGIKTLIASLEDGAENNLFVKTIFPFEKSIITVKKTENIVDVIKISAPDFAVQPECGSDEQWQKLLDELSLNNNNLDAVFENYSIVTNPASQFNDYFGGSEFKNWLYFIALKMKAGTIENKYLQFAINRTENFADFKQNIIYTISEFSPDDSLFERYYTERKNILKNLHDSELSDFVQQTKKDEKKRIFYLTDHSLPEREAIIETFSTTAFSAQSYKRIADIYPALNNYLRSFYSNCPEISEETNAALAKYFNDYKRQKMENAIYPEFEEQVLKLAMPQNRIYPKLKTREDILDKFDKKSASLYFMDALGAEYLGFIQSTCKELGLSIIIHIARAELPTITSFNKSWYDSWNGDKFPVNRELDELKHKENSNYDYTKTKLPVYLAKELDIIENMLHAVKSKLSERRIQKIIISSDHGASRLAVIKEQDLKYETPAKGGHSGRCCPYFEADDLPQAVSENGYLVLADYGRFKGSRAANVEAHGGALLEEVIVPVIEVTLQDSEIHIELMETEITASSRKPAEIELFSKNHLAAVSVEVNGKRYAAEKTDETHYKVIIPGIKPRKEPYTAYVFDGDNQIEEVSFNIASEIAKMNDDLF